MASPRVDARRAPSTADVSLSAKLQGHAALLTDYAGLALRPVSLDGIFADIDDYGRLLKQHSGTSLAAARVLEVGFGQLPFRLIALASMGIDVRGVDMEVPVLRGSRGEFRHILKENGPERFLKSLVRSVIFDRRLRNELTRELSARGRPLVIEDERFIIADATKVEFDPSSFGMIYSEDVFEHIPRDTLPTLVDRMAEWLSPGGLALIRPNVFSGVTGGHVVEWGQPTFAQGRRRRRTAPWAHLRGLAPPVNTYLNRLTLADYRALFEARFEILSEQPRLPDLGREYLTPKVAAELSDWAEEELFSNQVLFVLRPL